MSILTESSPYVQGGRTLSQLVHTRNEVIAATGALVALVTQKRSLAEALAEGLPLVMEALGASGIFVRRREPGTRWYHLLYWHTRQPSDYQPQPIVAFRELEAELRSGEWIHRSRDLDTGRFGVPSLEGAPFSVLLTAGLNTRDDVVGGLMVGFAHAADVPVDLREALPILAGELALLLEREQARQELDEHTRSLELQNRANFLALKWRDRVQDAFAELFALELGGARATVWVVDPDAPPGTLNNVGAYGNDTQASRQLVVSPCNLYSEKLCHRSATQGRTTLVWSSDPAQMGPVERSLFLDAGASTLLCCALRLPSGEVLGAVYTHTDAQTEVTPRRVANIESLARALTAGLHRQLLLTTANRSAAAVQQILDTASDMIYTLDANRVFKTMNATCKRVLGYKPSEMIGQPADRFVRPDDNERLVQAIRTALERDEELSVDIRCRKKDGKDTWLHVHARYLAAEGLWYTDARDISARKALEEQMAHLALHDQLTGLPNRALLHDRLEHALTSSKPRNAVAVLYLDLDRFNAVNDCRGHAGGDGLLASVARRLRMCLRPEDTVARLGGDEFVIVLEDSTEEYALRVAEHVASALDEPFPMDQGDVYVTACVGIALGLPGRDQASALLCNADTAMHRAKQSGKARHVVFDPSMKLESPQRLDLEGDLRRAMSRGELLLHYQPIVDLTSGAIAGAEALLRWAHPKRGLLQPREFLPLAEETGLIVPIGKWVLWAACRQARHWHRLCPGESAVTMCVNLSVREFQDPSLPAHISQALSESGLAPGRLQLDILEDVGALDESTVLDTVSRLKRLGVRIGVDNFGTGTASLSNLSRYGLDVLKVGRPFIGGVTDVLADRAIVSATVALAKTLHMLVVADGVESGPQLAHLRRLGCSLAQGFHLAKPMPADEFAALLSSQPRW